MSAERFKPFLRWLVVGLIFLGIAYNFILPFTPVWFDVVAWVAIALAFLIAFWITRSESDKKPGSN